MNRTQRGLLAVAGPAAVLRIADRATFVRRFLAFRFWLLQVATVLQRTAVDPQPHCDSAWIPSDSSTGNRGQGYHGKWYTPGWPWPFREGAGVVVGECSHLEGGTTPAPPRDCCSVIFGQVQGAKCLETAHHMVLEQTMHRHREEPDASAILDLSKVRRAVLRVGRVIPPIAAPHCCGPLVITRWVQPTGYNPLVTTHWVQPIGYNPLTTPHVTPIMLHVHRVP